MFFWGDGGDEQRLELGTGGICIGGLSDLDVPGFGEVGAVGGMQADVFKAIGGGDGQGGFTIDHTGDRVTGRFAQVVGELEADCARAAIESDFDDWDEYHSAADALGLVASERRAPVGFHFGDRDKTAFDWEFCFGMAGAEVTDPIEGLQVNPNPA